jgi:hypothetical protein
LDFWEADMKALLILVAISFAGTGCATMGAYRQDDALDRPTEPARDGNPPATYDWQQQADRNRADEESRQRQQEWYDQQQQQQQDQYEQMRQQEQQLIDQTNQQVLELNTPPPGSTPQEPVYAPPPSP